MADRLVGVTDQASGAGIADIRARERTVSAVTVDEQYVVPKKPWVETFRGFASTFRTLGSAATPQNIFTIENAAGSAVIIALRALLLTVDMTAATIVVCPIAKVSRLGALPTGGTALTKGSMDTQQPDGAGAAASSASVVVDGATASDGGVATAITATAGATGWSQPLGRMHTAAGQVLVPQYNLLPPHAGDDPLIIRAGDALLVQVVAAAAADNAASFHTIVRCAWEEVTFP